MDINKRNYKVKGKKLLKKDKLPLDKLSKLITSTIVNNYLNKRLETAIKEENHEEASLIKEIIKERINKQ